MDVLYIGAYIDITPLLLLKTATNFCYIDQCPNDILGARGFSLSSRGEKITHYDDTMFKSFIRKIRKAGFCIVDQQTTDTQWLFRLSNKEKVFTLTYYVNIVFPNVSDTKVWEDIRKCSVLYISGYNPDVESLTNIPLTIVGATSNEFKQTLKQVMRGNVYCLQHNKRNGAQWPTTQDTHNIMILVHKLSFA